MEVQHPQPAYDVEVTQHLYAAADGGFCVLLVRLEDGSSLRAAGELGWIPKVGELLRLEGGVETHPRYGARFRIQRATPALPRTRDGLERFLRSGLVKGVGRRLARRIVEHFGDGALDVLREDPARVSEVPGLGRKAAALVEALRSTRDHQDALVLLLGLGIGPRLAHAIWLTYGDRTATAVSRTPYRLITEVEGVGFRTADHLARAQGLAPDAPERLRAGIEEALREAMERGHVALPPAELVARAAALLERPADEVARALRSGVAEGRLELDFVGGEGRLLAFLPVLRRAEEQAAALLLERIALSLPAPIPQVPDAGAPYELSLEQRTALDVLLASRVAILTGGPGVGKTTVLREVVRAARAADLEVSLASPTGRAARRLAEATGAEATTLHRLLGILPDGRSVGDRRDLSADLLIVDEVSMLDLLLLVRLLRRLRPQTRLLLVGDPDQLPSVGPGSVLRDLIDSGRFPVTRLSRVYRQSERSHIVAGAHAVLAGERPRFCDRDGPGDLYFMARPDSVEGARLVVELFATRLPRRYGLDPRRDIQILTPMHKGPCGTEALNAAIQARLRGEAPALQAGEREFLLGDRVMVLRNDHDRGLANGDLGVVTGIDVPSRTLAVNLDDRSVEFSGQSLELLLPAYAITVHKSQGGEYPAVILPLFEDHRRLLQRTVLYTAITRARALLVMVGTERALQIAIANDRRLERHGALLERLRGLVRPADASALG
jgi:exodeoxyribonuclease V alpha subunit